VADVRDPKRHAACPAMTEGIGFGGKAVVCNPPSGHANATNRPVHGILQTSQPNFSIIHNPGVSHHEP
jgi:hypothetical protein